MPTLFQFLTKSQMFRGGNIFAKTSEAIAKLCIMLFESMNIVKRLIFLAHFESSTQTGQLRRIGRRSYNFQ